MERDVVWKHSHRMKRFSEPINSINPFLTSSYGVYSYFFYKQTTKRCKTFKTILATEKKTSSIAAETRTCDKALSMEMSRFQYELYTGLNSINADHSHSDKKGLDST